MGITDKDIETIALMHIHPSTRPDMTLRRGPSYRFFLDKVRLFLEFDDESVIISRNDERAIAGVLIYTYDERAFNRFCSPPHLRFFVRLLKTAIGYYGFDFAKFAKAAISMLGGVRLKKSGVSSPSGVYGKIWVLIVAEEERGKGIAGELLKECVRAIVERGGEELLVTVKTDNAPAIRVYEKMGFENAGVCEESSGHSHIMRLNLKSHP